MPVPRPLPSNMIVTHFTLVCGLKQYDFYPRADEVTVAYSHEGGSERYTMTVDEARDLWRRLKAAGYTRF